MGHTPLSRICNVKRLLRFLSNFHSLSIPCVWNVKSFTSYILFHQFRRFLSTSVSCASFCVRDLYARGQMQSELELWISLCRQAGRPAGRLTRPCVISLNSTFSYNPLCLYHPYNHSFTIVLVLSCYIYIYIHIYIHIYIQWNLYCPGFD
jgi:hypothetical protein